jgi:hypothetical protein
MLQNVLPLIKRAITDAPEAVFDVLCNIRLAGFNKRSVGSNSPAVRASNETVIGKVGLAGDPLGHV